MDARVAGERPLAYRLANVETWPAQRSIIRRGQATYLRPRTYDLLLYLLANRERIVTKEELVAQVWQNSAVTDNCLVQCIKEIRHAVGDSPREPSFIRTYPKLGYQVIGPVEEIYKAPAAIPLPATDARNSRTLWLRILGAAALLSASAVAVAWLTRDAVQPRAEPREVAWWRFDEPSPASAMATPPGRFTGSVSRVPGVNGSALLFRSQDALLSGESIGHLPSGAQPRTIAAWIKAVPNGDSSVILHYGGRTALPIGNHFALWIGEDGRLSAGNGPWGGSVAARTRVLDDQWHFLAAAYEGAGTNRVRLYVDGRLDGAGVLHHPAATSAGGGWAIGRYPESGTSIRGAVDELRVYRLALAEPEIQALFQCMSVSRGGAATGAAFRYAIPVWPRTILPHLDSSQGSIHNTGADFAGMQLANPGDCSLESVRGADVGQDLEIRVKLLCPPDPHGYVTQAGPYFRSRRALPGEGLLGGTSAGHWVMLHSNGAVKVLTMNPMTVAAFSPPSASFDASAWHDFEVRVVREQLRVWLDGKPVTFDQDRCLSEAVRLTASWSGPPVRGYNQGAAGISFACWDHPDCRGSQAARDIVVTRLK